MNKGGVYKFLPNRVRRSYTGGSGIDRLRGQANAADSVFPEEWIASAVEVAANTNGCAAGLSRLAAEEPSCFRDYLQRYPQMMLGGRHNAKLGAQTGFLMKLLDSAIRLPVQAHPTPEFSGRYLNSRFGKNEAWLVLETRNICGEEPYILLGFNERLDREVFVRESLSGGLEAGLEMLHRIPVKPGDVYFVPAGMPHALGPGLMIVEIMEPSDYIVISERFCGDMEISEARRFNGLPPEIALAMYDFTALGFQEALALTARLPVQADKHRTVLLSRAAEGYFGLIRLRIEHEYELANHERIAQAGLVTSGCIRVADVVLSAGDAFFLAAETPQYLFKGEGEIILAQPPLT